MIVDCSDESSSANEWLSAYAAFKLVCDHNGPTNAAASIVRRAGAGLIRTRAERFSIEVSIEKEAPTSEGKLTGEGNTAKHEFSNTPLPKEFWWTERGEELRQDWEAGDFSTLNEGKYQWEAFDVSFAKAGIVAMLAPLQPSSVSTTTNKISSANLAISKPMPSDADIRQKMKELCEGGMKRDEAAKHIRTIPGFSNVGNGLARSLAKDHLPRGRPKKPARK